MSVHVSSSLTRSCLVPLYLISAVYARGVALAALLCVLARLDMKAAWWLA